MVEEDLQFRKVRPWEKNSKVKKTRSWVTRKYKMTKLKKMRITENEGEEDIKIFINLEEIQKF